MSIRMIRPGLLTSVQDLGRRGRQQSGVNVGGAMDAVALRIANLLVGNKANAAALEMGLWGPVIEFDQDALVAVCGADLAPQVDDAPMHALRPVWVRGGSTLRFGSALRGAWAVLAVAGGVDVPAVMGSRSTHLRAAFGGFHGRALQAGDQLCLGSPSERTLRLMAQLAGPHSQSPASWSVADLSAHDDQPAVIRVLRGDQFSWLDADSQHTLYSADFEVTRHADRMGYRLAGPTLRFTDRAELLSEAVCCGTIQLPPQGQLIVLMADCATTGGYPKIAHVASVDLPRMAQIPPSGKVRFAEIGIAEAQQLYRAREATFERMKLGILSQEEG